LENGPQKKRRWQGKDISVDVFIKKKKHKPIGLFQGEKKERKATPESGVSDSGEAKLVSTFWIWNGSRGNRLHFGRGLLDNGL